MGYSVTGDGMKKCLYCGGQCQAQKESCIHCGASKFKFEEFRLDRRDLTIAPGGMIHTRGFHKALLDLADMESNHRAINWNVGA